MFVGAAAENGDAGDVVALPENRPNGCDGCCC